MLNWYRIVVEGKWRTRVMWWGCGSLDRLSIISSVHRQLQRYGKTSLNALVIDIISLYSIYIYIVETSSIPWLRSWPTVPCWLRPHGTISTNGHRIWYPRGLRFGEPRTSNLEPREPAADSSWGRCWSPLLQYYRPQTTKPTELQWWKTKTTYELTTKCLLLFVRTATVTKTPCRTIRIFQQPLFPGPLSALHAVERAWQNGPPVYIIFRNAGTIAENR
jgi:hypothetical protein